LRRHLCLRLRVKRETSMQFLKALLVTLLVPLFGAPCLLAPLRGPLLVFRLPGGHKVYQVL